MQWKKIKKIKKPLLPNMPIIKEHKKGPLIAPSPKENCKAAPADTNLSLVIKSFVCAKIRENIGKLQKENRIKKI